MRGYNNLKPGSERDKTAMVLNYFRFLLLLYRKRVLVLLMLCGFTLVYVSLPSTINPVDSLKEWSTLNVNSDRDHKLPTNSQVLSQPQLVSRKQEQNYDSYETHDTTQGKSELLIQPLDLKIADYQPQVDNEVEVDDHEEVVGRQTELKEEEEMACHLPQLDPLDHSILKYVRDPQQIQCHRHPKYPLLFKTDLRSTLIQVNKPENFGYYFCCYGAFSRKNASEVNVVFSKKCFPILNKYTVIPEDVDFIQISCTKGKSLNGKRKVVDFFGFVHLKKDVENRIKEINLQRRNGKELFQDVSETTTEHGYSTGELENDLTSKNQETMNLPANSGIGLTGTVPKIKANSHTSNVWKDTKKVNVVILGLDAISRMNFIRTMPLTYEYLTKNLSGLGLSGYTKVGDNTFPNIVPATTGMSVEELKVRDHCWENDSEYFDNCSFIWKNYSSQGYTTAYGEDAVWMGIFRYQKQGFKVKPTDYYYNTLTRLQDRKTGHAMGINANVCYGPRFGFEVLLDYLRKMAVTMNKERPYFQFIWATSLFHDYLNFPNLGDQSLLETLQWFKQGGYFDNTVFILMSDHGIRWGGIRSTLQGKLEERMPFLYFVFPSWFRKQYSSAVRNLIANEFRLTTPFDLYETLKDLLFLDNIRLENVHERSLNLMKSSKTDIPRGISLFLPVPLKRTCQDAEIAEHWCVCRKTESVILENNSLVEEAALSVVDFINEMFEQSPQCVTLELEEVLNAQVFASGNKKVKDASANIISASDPRLNKQPVTFSISILVGPSEATFEATTTRQTDGSWVISGDISRTNLYGEQSRCVSDYNLKKFCYCG